MSRKKYKFSQIIVGQQRVRWSRDLRAACAEACRTGRTWAEDRFTRKQGPTSWGLWAPCCDIAPGFEEVSRTLLFTIVEVSAANHYRSLARRDAA
jgi:hypothetical protein